MVGAGNAGFLRGVIKGHVSDIFDTMGYGM